MLFPVFYFLVFIGIFFNTSLAMAEDSLVIRQWQIFSTLLDNGGLDTMEDITFYFDSTFNGVFRDIELQGTQGVEDISVSELMTTSEIPYSLKSKAKNGDTEVFTVTEEKGKLIVKIFSPSTADTTKTFRLRYQVKAVATQYLDTGELYYQWIGKGNGTPIEFLSILIQLPQKISDEVKIFAHGPSQGNIQFQGEDQVEMRVSNVPASTFVEGRIIFPSSFIPNATKRVSEQALDRILGEELKKVQEAEQRNLRFLKWKKRFTFLSLSSSAFIIFLLAFFSSKLRRDPYYGPASTMKEIPEDCTPAVAAYLMNLSVTTDTIMSTIFDLARKGFIEIQEPVGMNLLHDLDHPDSNFTLSLIRQDQEGLLSHEVTFIDWLFHQIGNGYTVSTKEIEAFGKKDISSFYTGYHSWIKQVKKDTIEKEYFNLGAKKYGVFLIFSFFVFLGISIASLALQNFYGLVVLALSMISLFYGISLLYRRSDLGHAEYKKWKDFKADFNMKQRVASKPSLTLPVEISLIYAFALGVDAKLLHPYQVLLPESQSSSHWAYWILYSNTTGGNAFSNSFSQSFSSTSSGSGGGFSGGGGGGAGGGGAGGF